MEILYRSEFVRVGLKPIAFVGTKGQVNDVRMMIHIAADQYVTPLVL